MSVVLHSTEMTRNRKWLYYCLLFVFLLRFDGYLCEQPTASNEKDTEEIGYCAPYNGKVCKSYITSSQVWYSRVSVSWQYLFVNNVFAESRWLMPHRTAWNKWKMSVFFLLMGRFVCFCLLFAGRSDGRLGKWKNYDCSVGWIDCGFKWNVPQCSRGEGDFYFFFIFR